MKLPQVKPHSNAFMVFSMLLLGVFAGALVLVFDFWSGLETRTISSIFFKKLKETEIPLIWKISLGGLTLMASGFFFYLLSFFAIAPPAFFVRSIAHRGRKAEDDIFLYVSQRALEKYLPVEIANQQGRKFRDGFMYMLLTSRESMIAATARFAFTQLMYARALGVVFVLFTWYVNWAFSASVGTTTLTIASCWVLMAALYGGGLSFYERLMTSGILIDKLYMTEEQRAVNDAPPSRNKQVRKANSSNITSGAPDAEKPSVKYRCGI